MISHSMDQDGGSSLVFIECNYVMEVGRVMGRPGDPRPNDVLGMQAQIRHGDLGLFIGLTEAIYWYIILVAYRISYAYPCKSVHTSPPLSCDYISEKRKKLKSQCFEGSLSKVCEFLVLCSRSISLSSLGLVVFVVPSGQVNRWYVYSSSFTYIRIWLLVPRCSLNLHMK